MNLVLQKIRPPSPDRLAELVRSSPPACWLDSADLAHARARYSILALDPVAALAVPAEGPALLTIREGEAGPLRSRPLPEPEPFLESWLEGLRDDLNSPAFFTGGIVGFLGYESYARRLKRPASRRAPGLPDAYWLLVDLGLVIDHRLEEAWIFSRGLLPDLQGSNRDLALRRAEALRRKLDSPPETSQAVAAITQVRSDMTREQYLGKIASIREALRKGDCYQVNFAQRFEASGRCDPARLYGRLREVSPAPQMAFFNEGSFQILSASPETLLEIQAESIRSFPIKGTAPRHADPAQDFAERQRLWKSEKNKAELLMIVDMVRNDLGQFCRTGSVQVRALRRLEGFAQVHHTVSEIEGRLPPDLSPLRALQALSPGASITGAPKLKAIEIIDRLEESPRGVYTGSLGYAGFNRRACFNIAIRTLTMRGGLLHYSAGGGIVIDSEAEQEYEESLLKAKAFFEVLK